MFVLHTDYSVRHKTFIFYLLGWAIVNFTYSVSNIFSTSLLLVFSSTLFNMHWCSQFTTYKGKKMLSCWNSGLCWIKCTFCICFSWVRSEQILHKQEKREISILRRIPSAHMFVTYINILISHSKAELSVGNTLNTFSNSIFSVVNRTCIFNVSMQRTWDQK